MMRFKGFLLLSIIGVLSLTVTSCTNENPVFDGTLIVGKWVSGTEYYHYYSNGTGVTWDTSDDVSEEEGQPYTWDFDSETNNLVLVHQMEMGGQIPKTYTVTNLTESLFEYKDRYGQVFSFSRVK